MRRYQDAKIPLDVMWTDIDYMDQWRDFTLNQTAFSKNKMQAGSCLQDVFYVLNFRPLLHVAHQV